MEKVFERLEQARKQIKEAKECFVGSTAAMAPYPVTPVTGMPNKKKVVK